MLSRQSLLITGRNVAHCRTARCSAIAAKRSYATPTVNSRPPVAVYGIDGTYASALYSAAVKSSNLDPVAKAIASLFEVLKKDRKLPTILSAPALTEKDKSQIVQELGKHMGNFDKQGTVKNFLTTLAENNRLGILEGVCDKFATLISAANGEMELVITSAQKLDQKHLQRLETAISKSEYSLGKKLKVVSKINPDIKGGIVVEIGERTIDLSVQAKIAKMNKLLTDAL